MVVHKLSLYNYRNFGTLELLLNAKTNVFHGANAQGKTNLLEAIWFCGAGRSWRTNNDRELIMFEQTESTIRLLTRDDGFNNNNNNNNNNENDNIKSDDYYENKIEVHLMKDRAKGIAVNGMGIKKLSQLFGVLLTVVFSPEDLQLIKAGPSERRRFMDIELCQISNIYCHNLQQYFHILKQRNNLLKTIKSGKINKDTLFVWDEQLATYGARILDARYEFIQMITQYAHDIHKHITNGKEELEIIYKPNVSKDDFLEKLTRNIDRDILLGTTSVGVHKDDLTFLINGIDAKIYGSQGQQRTASLSAKLAEIDIVKKTKLCAPVLLLDDVLSELDESRQTFLLDSISGLQSIITCTGLELFTKSDSCTVYSVESGKIRSKD